MNSQPKTTDHGDDTDHRRANHASRARTAGALAEGHAPRPLKQSFARCVRSPQMSRNHITPDNAGQNPILGTGGARAMQLGLKFIF